MLEHSMQKKALTFVQKFNDIFTAQTLLIIIASLLGVVAARLMGF